MSNGNPFRKSGRSVDERDPDRPDTVDAFFRPDEEIGFEEGLPLASVGYDDYPPVTDLFDPASGDIVREIARHELSQTPRDVAKELGVTDDDGERAVRTHGCTDAVDGDSAAYDAPAEEGRRIPSPNDPEGIVIYADEYDGQPWDSGRVLAYLFDNCGLNADEIRDCFDDAPSARSVENNLDTYGLADYTYTGEGGTNVDTADDGGISIDASKY